ncbi:GNAT family N-acetyltransferase [Chitinibacter sp. FCG-7]|uniref:GNAT family N-acetyltransferase n=1 Tax=Chitinibacter mangrovi TaxID=3153927 RepID=A0AAU7FDI1_9NEIS
MTINPVTPDQYESLTDLLFELHSFYNHPPTASRAEINDHLLKNLLAGDSNIQLIVASEHSTVIGFAAILWQYSLVEPAAEQRKQCQLKELYVRSAHRGSGAGKALVTWIAQFALANGCGRMDWHVKASNERGIKFYSKLGGELVADRLSFRLPSASMLKLTQNQY